MSDDWEESNPSGGNYGGNPRGGEYNSSQSGPIYNQYYENSSYQNRGRGGRGGYNRPGGSGDDGGRQSSAYGRRPYNRSSEGFGNSDGRRQNNYGNNDSRGLNRNEDAVIIKVPSRFVGRIIGKGGSKIKDLQFESGARITVTKEEEYGETVVRLIGSADATKKAEEMIKDLTVDRAPSFGTRMNS